jgi:hypothetical protein
MFCAKRKHVWYLIVNSEKAFVRINRMPLWSKLLENALH